MIPDDSKPPSSNLTSRLKTTLDGHPIILLGGVFIAGIAMMFGIDSYFRPIREQAAVRDADRRTAICQKALGNCSTPAPGSDTNSKPPPYRLPPTTPIRITAFGPLHGTYSAFGLAHLRGIIASIMHVGREYCGLEAERWQELVRLKVVDTEGMSPDALAKAFTDREQESDIIVGPMSSGEVLDIFATRQHLPTIPVLLTTAAAPAIRDTKAYGQTLFQLSANLDEYSRQLMGYFARFVPMRPPHVLIAHEDTPYGRAGRSSLVSAAAQEALQVTVVSFVPAARAPSIGRRRVMAA